MFGITDKWQIICTRQWPWQWPVEWLVIPPLEDYNSMRYDIRCFDTGDDAIEAFSRRTVETLT
jgi:hypothetical protein